MAYSALALGHESLRLRSRRVRSDRSHGLSVRFSLALVIVAMAATVIGSVSPSIRAQSSSIVDPTPLDEQGYFTALAPIQTGLERSIGQLGLLAAVYQTGDVDRSELKARLEDFLFTYQRAEQQLRALDPPSNLRTAHTGYLDAVRQLRQSTVELLKLYEDGDQAHISAAVSLNLDTAKRLHALNDRSSPVKFG